MLCLERHSWQGNWHKNDEARFLCGGCPLHENNYSWTNEFCVTGFEQFCLDRLLGKEAGGKMTRR